MRRLAKAGLEQTMVVLTARAHESVGCDLWIVLEGEVWNGVPHKLAVNLKQQSTCASVLWTNVCVTASNGAVSREAAQI